MILDYILTAFQYITSIWSDVCFVLGVFIAFLFTAIVVMSTILFVKKWTVVIYRLLKQNEHIEKVSTKM